MSEATEATLNEHAVDFNKAQEEKVKTETAINAMQDLQEKAIPESFVDLLLGGKKDRVYKWVKKAGTTDEKPLLKDVVYVHYSGRLWGGARDGEQFDTSRTGSTPFSFELGKGKLIRGWDAAISTMKRHETAEIIFRTSHAVYKRGAVAIPPNSTLCFEVELVDFHGEDISERKDKSIMKRIIKAGEELDEYPGEFDKVTVNIVGRVCGAASETELFDRREALQFVVGEGSSSEPLPLPIGIELALCKMQLGELAKITVKPQLAFGAVGLQRDGTVLVPPDATLEYEVELVDCEKAKEAWEMTPDEKIEEAQGFKERANGAFVKAHYDIAEKYYLRLLKLLQNEDSEAERQQQKNAERRALRLTAYANLAQTYLNLQKDRDALQQADKALEIDEKHPKALFRKGVAHQRLTEFEAAKTAFERLLTIEPSNRAAQRELAVCENRVKQQLNSEKKLFKSLFDKIAAREEDEVDKMERELAEKAKLEREAEKARKKQRGRRRPGPPGSTSSSDKEDDA